MNYYIGNLRDDRPDVDCRFVRSPTFIATSRDGIILLAREDMLPPGISPLERELRFEMANRGNPIVNPTKYVRLP